MNYKALARFLYAVVPGLAVIRFAAKDVLANYFVKPEFRGILPLVKEGLIIDVGANRGQSTAAFKKLTPKCTIVAFEPEPKLAKRLISRYCQDENVTIYGCALGERSRVITFFIPKYGRWNCDGMAATDRETATSWLRNPGRMFWYDAEKLTVEEHLIECKTLDSYNLAPVLIKLHAQGAETEILKGAHRTVRLHRPALMCAFPSMALTSLLGDWGYRPYVYSGGRFVPGIAKHLVTFTWFLADSHVRQAHIAT